MEFQEALKTCSITTDLKADTKLGIIEELVDMMVADGKIPDRAAAIESILERERKMSTGMQSGVAVPHGKTDTIGTLCTAFGLKKGGIDFDSLDGEPSRIFIVTLSSPLETGPHIQFLAEISKMLSCPAVRDSVLLAETREDVIGCLLA